MFNLFNMKFNMDYDKHPRRLVFCKLLVEF